MTPVGERLLVQRHVQRFAHAHVGGWPFSGVEVVVVDRGFGCVHEILQWPNHVQPRRRHRVVVGRIELAGFIKAHHRGVFGEQVEDNFVQLHISRVPIHGITSDDDAVVVFPGFELEGAAGDDVRGVSPRWTKLLNRLLMEHTKKLVRHHTDKVRRGLAERNPQRVIIDSFDADVFSLHRNKLFAGNGVV